ncbi:MAG: alpha/beta hydrolase [Chloroflexi bacterium]|nr:alpha/beta hydrolase [Chloroflexota bacterium]
MPYFESDGARLHYEDADFTDPWRAPAPAVLLQHGFARNGRFWYAWVPLLARWYRVVRPDLRGMGGSTMPPEEFRPDLDTFVGDILHLLDHLGVHQVTYVGESFGGLVGLKLAHDHPQRVRALVLVNTPCRLSDDWRRDMRSDWGGAAATVGDWSRRTLAMRLDPDRSSPGLQDWYVREMDKTNPEVARKLQAYLSTLDFTSHLKDVRVPALLISGSKSPTSRIDQQHLMQREMPHAELAVFEDVGHGVNVVEPERCVERVVRFLEGLPK